MADPSGAGGAAEQMTGREPEAAIASELAASAELYDTAPCGLLSTLLDGTIVRINATLSTWLGWTEDEVTGRRRFTDLLTVGGRIHYETHIAPLLSMQGSVGGFALELRTADGTRLPVLVSSVAVRGPDGQPVRIRTAVFEARDRRSYENELLRARRQADADRERVTRLASVLQQTLLPPQLPDVPGVQTAAYYHPASLDEVGGDFYDLFRLPDGRWGFFLGDVCGKGAQAAVLTSLTRYSLRSTAVHDPDPVRVLRNLNAVLIQEHHPVGPRFCTVVYGVLDTRGDRCTITVASGGHPPPVLLCADGTARVLDLEGGQLVGAISEPRFTEAETGLAPGDTLLLHTDGLTEARIGSAHERTRYDEDDLLEFARSLAPASASATVDAVTALLDSFGDGLDDDTALLAIGRPPVRSSRSAGVPHPVRARRRGRPV
jgi:sigma-B regulation protein RsbU (phosphoserine phosphatase)